jgi:CDP-glucose 4,6-dehydratase
LDLNEQSRLNVDRGFWRKQRVLVTGASGFKGSWLCDVLALLGAQVLGTVRSRTHRHSYFNQRRLWERIDTAEVDVGRFPHVKTLINTVSPTIVFHLAAKALVSTCKREPLLAFNTNLMGTLNILEACRQLRIVDKLIICSTDHVFGDPPDITDSVRFADDAPIRHSGPYDTSKAAMELAVRSYAETYKDTLPAIAITRCSNVFGPGDVNQRRIIPEFILSALEDGEVGWEYPGNRRQYIFVLDAIGGYIRAAEIPDKYSPPPVYHFSIEEYGPRGQESSLSVANLAAMVCRAAEACGNRNVVTTDRHQKASFAPNENRFLALDCRTTRERLQWKPRWSLQEGLIATYRWHAAIAEGRPDAEGLLRELLSSAGLEA